MKDPYNPGKSLNECLDLPIESTPDEIKAKLTAELTKTGNLNISGALKAFIYDYLPGSMSRTGLLIADRNTEFETGKRYATGEKIDRYFRQSFPSDEASHLVFVFFYWSLRHTEELISNLLRIANRDGVNLTPADSLNSFITQLDQNGVEGYYQGEIYTSITTMKTIEVNDPAPTLKQMLRRLAQTAAILCCGSNYWEFQLKTNVDKIPQFLSELKNEMDKFFNGVRHRIDIYAKNIKNENSEENSKPDLTTNEKALSSLNDLYVDAHRLFLSELKLAEKLHQQQIRYRGIRINCGGELLKELNLHRAIQDQIEQTLVTQPDHKILREIQRELSTYHRILELAEKGQLNLALNEIAKLPTSEQTSPEIIKILPQLRFNYGIQKANNGEFSEMQKQWREAIQLTSDGTPRIAIMELMNQFTKTEAEKKGTSELKKAMDLLKATISLTESTPLKLLLGQYAVRYAQTELDQIESKANKTGFRCTEELVKQLADLVKSLEKAVTQGQNGAKKQLVKAQKIHYEAQTGLLGLPERFRNPLQKAIHCAQLGNHHDAVEIFRKITTGLGNNKSDLINTQFIESLHQAIKQNINNAINMTSAQISIAKTLRMKFEPPQKALELLNQALQDAQNISTIDSNKSDLAKKIVNELENVMDHVRKGTLPTKQQKVNLITQTVSMNYYSSLKWLFAAFLFAMVTIITILGEWKFLAILLPVLALSVLLSNTTHKK